jgi:4-hydroxybenzoate polyprenyltransferase
VKITANKLLDIFFLLRIPLLAPVWTIILLGWITGTESSKPGGFLFNSGNLIGNFHLWIGIAGFSFVVASIYVVNQIVDIESDRINHKLFLLPHGLVSVRTAWILAVFCAVSGIAIALWFDKVMLVLFLTGLALGALYDLKPFSLKNRAWGGVIANSLGHGMLTFFVGWYIAKIGTDLSIDTLKTGIISSLSPALANGAVFLATTIPDASGDKLTGKQTFCVKYGEKKTAILALAMCAGALFFSFLLEYNYWVMALPTAISLCFFIYFAFSTRYDIAFQTFKWPVFLLSASVAFFVPEYSVLIFATFLGSRIYYKKRFGIEYPTFKSK